MKLRLHNPNDRNPRPVKFKRVTTPDVDALELEYVKEELAVTHEQLDRSIQRLITLATNACETYTNRALITQTRSIYYDHFPAGYSIPLRFGPIQEITHLKIHKQDGTESVIDAADYYLTNEEIDGALTLNRYKYWATDILRPREGVEIEYVCGYGDSEEDIPAELVEGMINLIKWHFQEDSEGDIPPSIYESWNGYRLVYK